MINAIMTGIMNLIIGLVSVLLKPIDLAISTLLPDLSTAFGAIGGFFNYVNQGLGWAISASCLSSETLSLIVLYFTFKLTAPMTFYLIKLALSWYNRIKP